MSGQITCGEAAIRLLADHGVTTVFGIPGVHTLDFYRGLPNSGIRHVTPRHEQGAGFMADGYARISGKPGVCLLITGPGVTNAATPVAQAFSDSSPVLVLSSVVSRGDMGMGRGRLHDLTSQRATTQPYTKWSHTVMMAAELPAVMARAFAVMKTGRPRPVHVEVPLDVLASEIDLRAQSAVQLHSAAPDAHTIDEAAGLLAQAQRPLIIAGGGAVGAASALTQLADRIGAPVITTIAGKGILPDSHPLCFGTILSTDEGKQEVAAADVVLAIGTELSETDLWSGSLSFRKLIRVDIEPETLVRDHAAEVGILADARLAAEALVAALGSRPLDGAEAKGRVRGVRQAVEQLWQKKRTRHLAVLRTIRAALPADAAIAVDMTQIGYSANEIFPAEQPRSYFHPVGYGTLGFALPAAIGAKLGAPDRPVACLIGDGGLLFTVQELMTAVEEGLPIPIILWHNDGYGQIRDGMVRRGIPEIGVNLKTPDYLALGRAFGCHVARPESHEELKTSIQRALSADGPTLIEVRQDAAYLT